VAPIANRGRPLSGCSKGDRASCWFEAAYGIRGCFKMIGPAIPLVNGRRTYLPA
jgi:hypothetical protein